ncbi:hypothetical protein P153DRAFT_353483 [Dothidotthia symphoricarpi CBS 119687]|uniref:Uncharacterized protein n=1 Tax=Dothidotthia symphoricarpi CBS 119687 TaxID=1392245 RepID=A0A6A6AUV3_9PLEO|nr:uncharacterized protein P153DRAFT_353483 [Dothidotthia symphoricarpi CBS 119687]KAF2134321.1 hypothetical protein P153DRAFT_353483 [Dothidotthia symphoricarpi CBS 119687]
MAEDTSVAIGFFTLPRELRNAVYHQIWSHTSRLSIPHQDRLYELTYTTRSSGPSPHQRGLPLWLLANKQFLTEGLDQLLLNAAWSWGTSNPSHNPRASSTPQIPSSLLFPIKPSSRPFTLNLEAWSHVALRDLPAPELSLHDWHADDAEFVAEVLQDASSMQCLVINVTIADHAQNDPEKAPREVDFSLLRTDRWALGCGRVIVVVKSRFGRQAWWHEELRGAVEREARKVAEVICGKEVCERYEELAEGVATRKDVVGVMKKGKKEVVPIDVWRFEFWRKDERRLC